MKRNLISSRRVVSIKELAEYFCISRTTMYRYIKKHGDINWYNPYEVFDFVIWLADYLEILIINSEEINENSL